MMKSTRVWSPLESLWDWRDSLISYEFIQAFSVRQLPLCVASQPATCWLSGSLAVWQMGSLLFFLAGTNYSILSKPSKPSLCYNASLLSRCNKLYRSQFITYCGYMKSVYRYIYRYIQEKELVA